MITELKIPDTIPHQATTSPFKNTYNLGRNKRNPPPLTVLPAYPSPTTLWAHLTQPLLNLTPSHNHYPSNMDSHHRAVTLSLTSRS